MLGEQGFPGLLLWLLIQVTGLVRMEIIRRRYRRETGDFAWVSPLATALQHFQIIYLLGAVFVGIAYQPFALLMLSTQIGLDGWLSRNGGGRMARKALPARPAETPASQAI
jgi:hypothetical protein